MHLGLIAAWRDAQMQHRPREAVDAHVDGGCLLIVALRTKHEAPREATIHAGLPTRSVLRTSAARTIFVPSAESGTNIS